MFLRCHSGSQTCVDPRFTSHWVVEACAEGGHWLVSQVEATWGRPSCRAAAFCCVSRRQLCALLLILTKSDHSSQVSWASCRGRRAGGLVPGASCWASCRGRRPVGLVPWASSRGRHPVGATHARHTAACPAVCCPLGPWGEDAARRARAAQAVSALFASAPRRTLLPWLHPKCQQLQ